MSLPPSFDKLGAAFGLSHEACLWKATRISFRLRHLAPAANRPGNVACPIDKIVSAVVRQRH
jgi:hypothetical protein